jgi:hypothetical protein
MATMSKNDRFKTQSQRKRTSKGELDLYKILKMLFPLAKIFSEYPYSRFCDTSNEHLRADIYISTFQAVFEYDGNFHTAAVCFGKTEEDIFNAQRAFEESQRIDKLKNQLCESAGVKLVRILYSDWNKLTTDEEKKSYILDRL